MVCLSMGFFGGVFSPALVLGASVGGIFTYIGNLPSNFNFKHTKVIEPLAGVDLANEIKKNHIYINILIIHVEI